VRQTTYGFFRRLHGLTREHDGLRRGRLAPLQVRQAGSAGPADGGLDDAVVAFLRFLPGSGEAFLVALNYDGGRERWAAVRSGWPMDGGLGLGELLGAAGIPADYAVDELLTGRPLGRRSASESLVLGLEPLQLQVLWLRPA
jgi:hypothetical protein